MASQAEKAETFRKLHQSGTFVIPNPWDIGSARMLQAWGFKALATTSVLALLVAAAPCTISLHGGALIKASVAHADSCFIASTRVLMADHSWKAIALVRAGDAVIGMDGVVNRVTGVERVPLGGRLLYSLNGGPAFVTAEHPFLGIDGWRSIQPEATRRENSELLVAPLSVGDRLQTIQLDSNPMVAGNAALAPMPALQHEVVEIRSVIGVTADPRLTVFNLLLDGNHSYIADGFVVHNKGGLGIIEARHVVDCSADADMAARESSEAPALSTSAHAVPSG